jgi:hypothetical protein
VCTESVDVQMTSKMKGGGNRTCKVLCFLRRFGDDEEKECSIMWSRIRSTVYGSLQYNYSAADKNKHL